MHRLKYLLLSIIFVSCSHFSSDKYELRNPSSGTNPDQCILAAYEFSLDYLTHPRKQQFKGVQHFLYFYETLAKYKVEKNRLYELAADPDHNNLISKKSIQEAQSVLIAERKDLMPGPIIRGPEEIDFYDKHGRPWDVKTPISPKNYEMWEFNIEKVKNSITHQLAQTYDNFNTHQEEPVRVLIDLRKTKMKHRQRINGWIFGTLSPEEISRIKIIQ